ASGEGADPRTGWRQRLDDEQVERILRVVRAFGIDFYDEATEPDLRRLERFGTETPALYASAPPFGSSEP
ncbi:MAG TPA: hypothetical protein VFV33_02645, partial [Gemmatimonadaceae bacterium]|nr:hypothetical protein [Gemmatimonadaceae bacterium]